MSQIAKHTPGPWCIRGGMTPKYTYIIGKTGDVIDSFGKPRKPSMAEAPEIPLEEHRANTRLIAAAPDLLAAARCALADVECFVQNFLIEGEHPVYKTVVELKAAIAKATGGDV